MIHLPNRSLISITGQDRFSFLQGLMTNDIHLLEKQESLYAALLTPQGRFVYDFFIFQEGDKIYLDTREAESVLQKLSLFKLRAQVSLELSAWKVYSSAEPLLDISFLDPRLASLGYRCYGRYEGTLGPLEDYLYLQLLHGVPEGGVDLIPQKSIPLECGLEELSAISWTKGCYMGQELTARTHYQGLIRKRLVPAKVEGRLPNFGEVIFGKEGEVVGEVRTSLRDLSLLYLRLEALSGPLWIEGAKLFPYVPDWMRLTDPSLATNS